jgi:hypothetical protein
MNDPEFTPIAHPDLTPILGSFTPMKSPRMFPDVLPRLYPDWGIDTPLF